MTAPDTSEHGTIVEQFEEQGPNGPVPATRWSDGTITYGTPAGLEPTDQQAGAAKPIALDTTAPAEPGTASANLMGLPTGTTATVTPGGVSVLTGGQPLSPSLSPPKPLPLTSDEPLAQLPEGTKVVVGAQTLVAHVPVPGKPGVVERIESAIGAEIHNLVDDVKAFLKKL